MPDGSEAMTILKHSISKASAVIQREFLAIITGDHEPPQSNQEPYAGPRRIWRRLSEQQQAAFVKWLESEVLSTQQPV